MLFKSNSDEIDLQTTVSLFCIMQQSMSGGILLLLPGIMEVAVKSIETPPAHSLFNKQLLHGHWTIEIGTFPTEHTTTVPIQRDKINHCITAFMQNYKALSMYLQ